MKPCSLRRPLSAAILCAVSLAARADEPLPPGIRSAGEREGVSWLQPTPEGPDAPRLLELIGGEGGADDWLQVEYTVDPALDARVRAVLAERGVALGHVVLLDADTGEVYSYVSTDPERFPATRAYPMASLMKVVTAAAVLRHAPDAAERDCRYLGNPYRLQVASLLPPGELAQAAEIEATQHVDSFQRAMAISNNQCFARLAVRDVGQAALLEELARLGLLEPPGAGHAPGRVEEIEGDLALGYLGSGLAGAFVTPLGAARLAAALASGERVTPRWIARVRHARGIDLPYAEPLEPEPVWPPELAARLRELLVEVTAGGTARGAFHDESGEPLLGPVRVAGKTGTLGGRDPEGLYQWFIGLAPAEEPKVAIAVLVVHETAQGTSASAVAAAALRELFCAGDGCDAARVGRLHARARRRDEAARREVAAEREALARAHELDRAPRPIDPPALDFPRALRRAPASGTVVLLLDLDRDGTVRGVEVERSDLPAFEAWVVSQVEGWRFTPPTRAGRPVPARARLPLPIQVH